MAEKIIDGNSKENVYNLLCNLANLDNKSIVFDAVNKEIESTKLEKEKTDNEIEDITSRLELAKYQKGIMSEGPDSFSKFINDFHNNQVLKDYLHILGFDNYLDNLVSSHDNEQRTNDIKVGIEKDIARFSDQLKKLELESLNLEEKLQKDAQTLDNINNATDDVKCLIEASVGGNGSFNKDYVVGLLSPFEELAKKLNIIFPDNFVEVASKAIFFPEDGFAKVVEEYSSGKNKDVSYTEVEPEKIDIEKAIEGEEIKTVQSEDIEDSDEMELVSASVGEDITFSEEDKEQDISDEQVEETDEEIEEEDKNPVEEDNIFEDIVPVEDIVAEVEPEVTEESEKKEIEATEDVEENNTTNQDDITPDQENIGEEVVEEQSDTFNVADKIIEEMNDEVVALETNEPEDSKDEFGLDESKMSEELKSLIKKADKKLIRNNLESLKALNVKEDAWYFVNGSYSYLTDKDLASKLNYLRSKRLPEKAIVDVIEYNYVNCGLEKLKEGGNNLENSDLGFDKQYLVIFKYGIDSFFKALEELKNNGIEPDDSEIAAYLSILAKYSDNVAPDTEVLKDYGISLLRKNGKYELGLYMKSPKDLVQAIDDVIENGEEALINSTPEVLAVNTDTIINRLLYVKANNIEYKEGEVYADYIYKPILFDEEFGNPKLENIGTCEECNNALKKSLNNDLCSIFIEVLDKFYDDSRSYKAVELSGEEKGVFEELKGLLEKEFNAKLINKNTYEMNDVAISRNKFERNLSCLVSALMANGEDLLSEAREILIVSALYNSRRPEGMMMNIPQEVEKDSVSLGGMAA